MDYLIKLPTGNTRGPGHTEQIVATMHKLLTRKQSFGVGIRSVKGTAELFVSLPDQCRAPFLQEIQDAYPGISIAPCASTPDANNTVFRHRLDLTPDVLLLSAPQQFLDDTDNRQFADPMAGLMAAVQTGRSGRVRCSVRLQLRPAPASRRRQLERTEQRLKEGFSSPILKRFFARSAMSTSWLLRSLSWLIGRMNRGPYATSSKQWKSEAPLFVAELTVDVTTSSDAASIAHRKLRQVRSALSRYTTDDAEFRAVRCRRRAKFGNGFLITPGEVSTLWHPLCQSGDHTARVSRSVFRELEPPHGLPFDDGPTTILGRTAFRGQRQRFGIAIDDLRRHLIAVGKTGCGKSTFLKNVVAQQMEAGRGVILIDPHGQLADDVLDVVPRRRTNDVICFDAGDQFAPVGFNPMSSPAGTDPALIADGILTSFQNVFGLDAGSAPRLLHILRNCLLTLVGTPHASLSSVQRILVDAPFRRSVIAGVSNPAVRDFWTTEFNRWNDRDRTQYIASLQNKLGAFTTSQCLQRILDGRRKGISLRQVMDQSQILVCNLSKGNVGHDASTLLGSLLLSSLQISAMSRADMPEEHRSDCVVVIDEFHSYLSDGNATMASALAESRKYRTSYVLSTQMLEQLDDQTLAGVLGNCGSALCMTVGPRDAEVLARLLGRGLTPEDLMNIPQFHGYLRLLTGGVPHTFSMTTLPPASSYARRADIVRRVSRQRFSAHCSMPAGTACL